MRIFGWAFTDSRMITADSGFLSGVIILKHEVLSPPSTMSRIRASQTLLLGHLRVVRRHR